MREREFPREYSTPAKVAAAAVAAVFGGCAIYWSCVYADFLLGGGR